MRIKTSGARRQRHDCSGRGSGGARLLAVPLGAAKQQLEPVENNSAMPRSAPRTPGSRALLRARSPPGTGHPRGTAAGEKPGCGSGVLKAIIQQCLLTGKRSGNFRVGFDGCRQSCWPRAVPGSSHTSPRAVFPCPHPVCASWASPKHPMLPGSRVGAAGCSGLPFV